MKLTHNKAFQARTNKSLKAYQMQIKTSHNKQHRFCSQTNSYIRTLNYRKLQRQLKKKCTNITESLKSHATNSIEFVVYLWAYQWSFSLLTNQTVTNFEFILLLNFSNVKLFFRKVNNKRIKVFFFFDCSLARCFFSNFLLISF